MGGLTHHRVRLWGVGTPRQIISQRLGDYGSLVLFTGQFFLNNESIKVRKKQQLLFDLEKSGGEQG